MKLPSSEFIDLYKVSQYTYDGKEVLIDAYTGKDLIPGKFIYCELISYESGFGSKSKIVVDYGSFKDLLKENGSVIRFESVVDGLNYMSGKGWEMVQAYAITKNDLTTRRFLMKKPLD